MAEGAASLFKVATSPGDDVAKIAKLIEKYTEIELYSTGVLQLLVYNSFGHHNYGIAEWLLRRYVASFDRLKDDNLLYYVLCDACKRNDSKTVITLIGTYKLSPATMGPVYDYARKVWQLHTPDKGKWDSFVMALQD